MGGRACFSASQSRQRVYEFTPDQSYNDGYVKWAEAQAFVLTFHDLTAGGYDEYVEQQHIASEYLKKAQIPDEEWLGFSQHCGAGAPISYVYVTPLRSLAMIDSAIPHDNPLPPEVDRARDAVLLKSVASMSITLVTLRPDLSCSGSKKNETKGP